MHFDATDVVLSVLKIAIVLGLWLNVTPIMVWVERRGSALIQDRPGPNRVGPFGLFQSFADALKFILKEDIIPAQAHKWLYTLAPVFGLLPALTTIAVVPWGRPFVIPEMHVLGRTLFEGGRLFEPIVADVNAGILVVFALASLGVYGITIAGWASREQVLDVRRHPRLGADDLVRAVADAGRGERAARGRLAAADRCGLAQQTGYYFVLFDSSSCRPGTSSRRRCGSASSSSSSPPSPRRTACRSTSPKRKRSSWPATTPNTRR